ncbi:acyl-CoA dehydrogenase family protein [Sphingomonas sp. KR1UV-12]|uniref:Acyl-CoA dehydrogenase family protein n=1 Tax=Sphingomonas aurea TaxID=3063994 RepID=A0ABT9EI33_9SPHN|nr:acyl-CoA dehydrogenase family protein [Sphingomonas sp. KR1UV-12]MDP1026473.1 acyl-CoA dehydrogenase family protein [Sphingomonas sp. KR1UV-12]
MDFHHYDDRQMLADTLRRYLAAEAPVEARNRVAYGDTGYSPAVWAGLGELGIAGALFGEDAGGFGGSGFDIMVVFEELGRALAVEPFLGTLMAGRALAIAAPEHAALAEIVAGTSIIAFAHQEPQDRAAGDPLATRATKVEGGWSLDGAKAVVAQAEAAALLLVSAETEDGRSLFLVPAGAKGLTIRGYANVDGGRSAEVTLRGVVVADRVAADGAAAIAEAEAAGLLALSAEGLGAMEVAKEATIEYLRTRKQFGVPIGKFQALQHRIATVLMEVEQARSAVINAADAFDNKSGTARDRILSAAKHTIGAIGQLVAEEAIQMHGGIGMTWELPLSHYAKRITMIDQQLGDQDQHLQRFIALGRS